MLGSRIEKVEEVYDYWQWVTDKGSINIYNPFEFSSKGNRIRNKEVITKDSFNEVIINVDFVANLYVTFVFSNDIKLKVSLLDEDYTAPEAISIHFKTGELIVI